MKFRNSTYPLVKLPIDVQLPLFLIKEELKSRKFFNALQQTGLDDCYFQPHLDTLILRTLDMDDDSDKTFDAYCEIMERRSKKIDIDNDSIMKQALKAYYELLEQRKKLNAVKKEVKLS
ncbi:MAG: hypothetical protein DI539_17565 [Flavobacterium psychrophilum]|nr:MAG: hypothetical protein DI539_17565 [Flavobacterium psychrophilum]